MLIRADKSMGLGRSIRIFDNALDQLNHTLSQIEHDENPIIETLSRDIKHDLEEVMDALEDFLTERDPNILDDLLEEKRLFKRCEGLLSKCENIFPRYVMYISKKVTLAIESRRNDLLSIGEKLQSVLNEISGVSHHLHQRLVDSQTSDAEIMVFVKDSFRNYAKAVGKRTQRELEREAQKFKERRNASLTPEVWGLVLENEERALELARDGRLTSDEYLFDGHFEAFTDNMRKQMEESYPLMQKILSIGRDDQLFDFEYAFDPYINLLADLNCDNIDMFNELILRHNIIRCGACPELKAKFERWMQGEEVRADSASATTDDTRAEAEELCHLIHPKWWGNENKKREIHNEIKGLVTNYGIQDICIHLNEMKQQERVMLPTGVQQAFDELQRMGMPTDKKGYDYKTFAKYYNK